MPILPVAPRPLPGELLASWIGRLACLYDAPPDGLWYELAGSAPAEMTWAGASQAAGDTLPEQFARVAAATRLDVRAVSRTTMRTFLPVAPAAWLRSVTVSTSQVPWCSACLREDAELDRATFLRRIWAAGCVVICPRHRAPLVDTCSGCERRVSPAFQWTLGGPRLICATCGATLHDQTGTPGLADSGQADDGASAAIAGIGWVQTMLLRALRGAATAGPAGFRRSWPAFLTITETLVGHLLFPLGITHDARAGRTGKGPPLRCTPTGLPARQAFAVMAAVAAVLALPDEELDDRFEGALWRQRQRGEPIDLSRLWTEPNRGGGALRCDRQHWYMAVDGVGVAVALAVLGDPAIAAYMAAKRRLAAPAKPGPRTEEYDHFGRLAHSILTDPDNVARLAAARTPAARRRVLSRLSRKALLPSPARADPLYAPGRAAP